MLVVVPSGALGADARFVRAKGELSSESKYRRVASQARASRGRARQIRLVPVASQRRWFSAWLRP